MLNEFCFKSLSTSFLLNPYITINFKILSSTGYIILYVLHPPVKVASLKGLNQGCLIIF